jgi:hypothetical protein
VFFAAKSYKFLNMSSYEYSPMHSAEDISAYVTNAMQIFIQEGRLETMTDFQDTIIFIRTFENEIRALGITDEENEHLQKVRSYKGMVNAMMALRFGNA